ncbi:MAG TPA: hypothetical protein VK814_10330 [Acidobacteriaceae bacterium]|nr:hypothetical protein [Acidobacteriaceae bacterium]
MRAVLMLIFLTTTTPLAQAQWTIQTPTTADLRGIDNVGKGIAWASGTNGTVLRTEDAGYLWQRCTIPPGAEHLDFRGIQAFDANTAIVMSSGPGDQSRLYKTTDGCQTWTLLFTNPDKEGFWDAITFQDKNFGVLIGDPVDGKFFARQTADGGRTWRSFADDNALAASSPNAGIFAASNSSLFLPENPNYFFLIANTQGGSVLFESSFGTIPHCKNLGTNASPCPKDYLWSKLTTLPLGPISPSKGVFSVGVASNSDQDVTTAIVVGGDYLHPNDTAGTAAYSTDSRSWQAATTPPHGYRSSVAYDPKSKTWITVGPNGTDISTDDGRNWRPLHPTNNDAPDADQHWNALSLPYAVGPHGRIGILNPSALQPSKP